MLNRREFNKQAAAMVAGPVVGAAAGVTLGSVAGKALTEPTDKPVETTEPCKQTPILTLWEKCPQASRASMAINLYDLDVITKQIATDVINSADTKTRAHTALMAFIREIFTYDQAHDAIVQYIKDSTADAEDAIFTLIEAHRHGLFTKDDVKALTGIPRRNVI